MNTPYDFFLFFFFEAKNDEYEIGAKEPNIGAGVPTV